VAEVSPRVKPATEKLCKVAESAAHRLQTLLSKKGWSEGALRIAVVGGGCSGLQYKMDLVEAPRDRDLMVEALGVRVVIDPKSALFVSGSTLEFSSDLQKGGFKVTNPNATSHCSCGQSFSA
jgi:iron-sulfur cluster assembly protein